MEKILETIKENYRFLNDADHFAIDRKTIIRILHNIRKLFFKDHFNSDLSLEETMEMIREDLRSQIEIVDMNYEAISDRFMKMLPEIQNKIYKDVMALYNGDPSAKTFSEIIESFPGFLAILYYRIAHALYLEDIPIIPRIIAEYAHEKTGIDINPGATIGEYFCIDHGTGIVIGETATIGDHVRMYHGVTLGVRKFSKDENGALLKGGKRHPDIGNYVTIYANATILGGDTRIEDYAVVAANSLIMESTKEK